MATGVQNLFDLPRLRLSLCFEVIGFPSVDDPSHQKMPVLMFHIVCLQNDTRFLQSDGTIAGMSLSSFSFP